MKGRPERASRSQAPSRRWAVWHRQFDLVRVDDGSTYLTRWWIVKTPWGGLALHRMTAGDARETVHDHPFAFVSLVLLGGYVERRLHPRALTIDEERVVRRVNVMRRDDAHSIRRLLRVPTWTLLLCGRHRRSWGFYEPVAWDTTDGSISGVSWTRHDRFDSGHYVPERG